MGCGYEIAIVTGKQCELQIENSDWKTLCGAGDELVETWSGDVVQRPK